MKFEKNEQVEGYTYDRIYQPKDAINTFAMVNKIVYTKGFGNLTFSPGIKFRFYKKGRSESLNPLDHYMMRIPLVYVQYHVSPKTNISWGMQGLKGFEVLYKDYIQNHNDYRQLNYILQIENRTNYFGFEVWGGFGFQIEHIMFDEDYRKFEEYKSSSFFVKMFIGH